MHIRRARLTRKDSDSRSAPGFSDSNNNLHLSAGAAAINVGDPTSYPSQDIDGQTRPNGNTADAGADEAG